MAKARIKRLATNVWSENNIAANVPADAAEISGRYQNLSVPVGLDRAKNLKRPDRRHLDDRRPTVRLRGRHSAALVTADFGRSAHRQVDLVIDLLFRAAETQRNIRVDNDKFTIERTLSDINDRSKTVVLLRGCRYSMNEHQPFIRALQIGTLARMMLGMHPKREHRSIRPASPSGHI